MKTPVDERLRKELRDFSMRFTCEDCVWFDQDSAACALGYPNHEHRAPDLNRASHIVFCKEFELAS